MKTRWKILITWASAALYVGVSYALIMYVVNPNFLQLGVTSWLLISFLIVALVISGMELVKLLKRVWQMKEES